MNSEGAGSGDLAMPLGYVEHEQAPGPPVSDMRRPRRRQSRLSVHGRQRGRYLARGVA